MRVRKEMDVFKLILYQEQEEWLKQNNRERVNSLKDPENDNLPTLKFQLPVPYEGPKDDEGKNLHYTPEHFFIAAVTGCFFTTFSVVSSNSKFKYKTLKIESEGYIGTSTGVKMMEKIKNHVYLTIEPPEREKKALKVLELTEKACPLGNSVKSKLEYEFHVIIE